MKNLYNITKAQLITTWIFGALTWLFILLSSQDSYNTGITLEGILFFLIPFLLIFYTFGWSNNRKKN